MDRAYHLLYQCTNIKNASHEEEAKVGVMWLEAGQAYNLQFDSS
jgi:hypothetical protein